MGMGSYYYVMDSLELLKALGLSTYEAEVYRALLKVDKAKVQDLARVVAVPRPQIYVALGALLEKGLCREIRGKVTFYAAVAPATAFRSALRREEESLKAKAEGIRALDEEHHRLEPESVPPNFVQVLRGRQIRHSIDEFTAATTEELLISLKYVQEQTSKSVQGAVKAESAMLERGIHVRCLYEQSALQHAEVRQALRQLTDRGEEARMIETVPMDLMIFDHRVALFSLAEERGGVTVFVFAHPSLVESMRLSFDSLWQSGTDVKERLVVSARPGQ
jgi:HTH-type transcriptional regulator, sugar sensing transcriptional regulator